MFRTAALAVLLTLPPAQDAKSSAPAPVLARIVPKDAFFLVQATSLDSLRADFEAGAWYAMYQDDEMKGIRTLIESAFDEMKAKAKAEGGSSMGPWDCLATMHGSFAVFGHVEPGARIPSIGILLDPGEPRGAFEDLLAKTADEFEKKSELAQSTSEYAGVELRIYETQASSKRAADAEKHAKAAEQGSDPDEEGEKTSAGKEDFHDFAYYDHGGVVAFFMAPSREELLQTVHGVIDRSSGKDPSTGLEGSAIFTQARASVAKPGRVELFLDVGAVVGIARAEHPPDEKEQKVMEKLGVDGLRWIYGSGDIGKGEAVSFDFAAKIPEKGYLRDWIGLLGKAPKDLAAGAPRECVALSLVQFDVWGLWQSVWKFVGELDETGAQNARAQMEGGLSQFGADDLEKSFLSQIDGKFLSFNVPIPDDEWKAQLPAAFQESASSGSGAAGHQGTAMVLGLRDVPSVSRFVEGVLKAVGAFDSVKTEEFQGNQIHRFSVGPGNGFSWAYLKQGAAFSQSPSALRAALRMETAEKKDSALEKESFKPLYDAHGDASLLSLATTAESLKGGLVAIAAMRAVAGMGGMMGGQASDSPLEHLPSSAAIDRHFKGTTASTISRSGGVLRFHVSAR